MRNAKWSSAAHNKDGPKFHQGARRGQAELAIPRKQLPLSCNSQRRSECFSSPGWDQNILQEFKMKSKASEKSSYSFKTCPKARVLTSRLRSKQATFCLYLLNKTDLKTQTAWDKKHVTYFTLFYFSYFNLVSNQIKHISMYDSVPWLWNSQICSE